MRDYVVLLIHYFFSEIKENKKSNVICGLMNEYKKKSFCLPELVSAFLKEISLVFKDI